MGPGRRAGAAARGLCGLLCSLALALPVQAWQKGIPPPPERVLRQVFADPRPPAELRRRLAGLEASAIPVLFGVAARGALPRLAPLDETQVDESGTSLTPLSAEERRLVREALAARPRREIIPFLQELSATDAPIEERLEAQRLLGASGTGDHLKLLSQLTASVVDRRPLRPDLRLGFREALERILARDVAAIEQMRELFLSAPVSLSGSIVDALGGVRTVAATRCLSSLLGRSPGLDPLILARLGERGGLPGSADESVREAVRRYLSVSDGALLSTAARAAGQLRDDAAVERLVLLLEHPEERVRENACAALGRISGLGYGRESERWIEWFRAETRWWDTEAEALLIRVERAHGAEFVRAATAVLKHRLYRDRIASAFAAGLARRPLEELQACCRALEQLGSPVALRALIECLDRPEPQASAAAWRALKAITGVDAPPGVDAWVGLLG